MKKTLYFAITVLLFCFSHPLLGQGQEIMDTTWNFTAFVGTGSHAVEGVGIDFPIIFALGIQNHKAQVSVFHSTQNTSTEIGIDARYVPFWETIELLAVGLRGAYLYKPEGLHPQQCFVTPLIAFHPQIIPNELFLELVVGATLAQKGQIIDGIYTSIGIKGVF